MGKRLTNEEVQKRISETFKQNVFLVGDYINKRTPIQLKCLDCGHSWSAPAQSILYLKDSQYHYCPNCYLKKEQFFCSYCGKEIFRVPSQIEKNKSGYFYCSIDCGNHHKNQIRKDSGEWDNSLNYRKKALDAYPHKCLVCGWEEDPRILEVHHIDEDRENNRVENLCILCPNCHKKITLGYYKLVNDVLVEV